MGGREEYLSLIDGGAAGSGVGQLGPEVIGRLQKEPISASACGSVAEGPRQNEFIARLDATLPPTFPVFEQGDNGGGNGSNAANTSVV